MNTVGKKQKRLLIDMNAILNSSLLGGKDHEHGRLVTTEEGKETWVNGYLWGVDKFIVSLANVLEDYQLAPIDIVGVWDGKNAKAYRQNFLPQYKAGRDKAPEVYEELTKAREVVNNILRYYGATVVVQDGAEADDVLAFLTQQLKATENIIWTVDGDLCALVDDNAHVLRKGEVDENPYGAFPHKHILTYKSLVGDTSDRIPGAKGFGDAAFVKLVAAFGIEGLDQMLSEIENGTLPSLQENVEDLPALAKVVDDADNVTNSWRAAKLYPQRVNTNSRPLQVLPGFCNVSNELSRADTYEELHSKFAPQVWLVTADNYEQRLNHFRKHAAMRFEVALDIETSTPEESDEWLESRKKRSSSNAGVDVLGSQLTGMSLTYGDNMQYTVYMSVDHKDTPNITVDQCREWCETIPKGTEIVIQNRAFEFPVLYKTWGDKWKDNGWYGFMPNAWDTAIEASYVDENQPRGLKRRAKTVLGYDQTTYDEVTGGRKMSEMTAQEVLSYGADDTCVTAALHTYYRFKMECEGTWDAYRQVEQLPEYLTSLAYVQGLRYSKARLRELEEEDQATFDANWGVLRDYLMERGWEGTVCPVYEEITPAAVKEAYQIVTGEEFASRKRKLDALAIEVEEASSNPNVAVLAGCVRDNDVESLNALLARLFNGEPKFNFDSPRQKQDLFYRVIGMQPRILNKLTDKQRENPAMREAFNVWRNYQDNPSRTFVSSEVREVWFSKASTDDDAIELALTMDNLPEREREVLEAYSALRTVQTRFKMFYQPYTTAAHWSDGRLHPELIQCEAVTRRYSSRNPNAQQLPSRGEGVKFREVILPHHKDAVVVSLDFAGQELRLMADECRDENMLACYVGDNKKDMHSLVAVSTAPMLWGEEVTYEQFMDMYEGTDEKAKAKAEDLRSKGKGTNFGTQFGAAAPKLAIMLRTSVETAQAFIDAKDVTFPGINKWKAEFEAEAKEKGFATTKLGARRHLSSAFDAESKYDVMRAERQASNFRIQSSAGEMSRLAMASMWRSGVFTDGKYDVRWYFPVHDEAVVSVHKDDATEVIKILHACMVQQYADMTVPLESEIAIGLNFGDMKVVGKKPDSSRIVKVLENLFGEVQQ